MPRAATTNVKTLYAAKPSAQARRALGELPELNAEVSLEGVMLAYFGRMYLGGRWSGETMKRQELDLGLFVRLDPQRPIGQLGVNHMYRWIGAVAHLRYATQHSRWQTICQFLDWCVRKELLAKSPARQVDLFERPWTSANGQRQIEAGKPQLPNMEAVVAFCAAANKLRDIGARIGVQLLVLCGMRSGEVRNLRTRDVDFLLERIYVRPCDSDGEGRWDTKSAYSRRTVMLPAALRGDLRRVCEGKADTQLLFPRPRATKRGEVMRHANWLIKAVRRVCDKAELARVCPHGLRGTWATMQVASGVRLHDVSAALGHSPKGGNATLRRHYLGTAPVEQTIELPDIAAPTAA